MPEESTPTDAHGPGGDFRAARATPAAAAAPAAATAARRRLRSAPPKPAGASGPGDVPCPLSGRVTAVLVQAGQMVKEGDHLVTLEAMKMNTFVFAPRSGKVTAVRTEVGAVVEEKQVLVTIG